MPRIVKKLTLSVNSKIAVWLNKKIEQKYSRVQRVGLKDLERGLLILKISKDEFHDPWLTAEEITSLLIEVFNLPSTSIGITSAFAKAGGNNKNNKPVIIQKKDKGGQF